jgi:hypothetical protein
VQKEPRPALREIKWPGSPCRLLLTGARPEREIFWDRSASVCSFSLHTDASFIPKRAEEERLGKGLAQ